MAQAEETTTMQQATPRPTASVSQQSHAESSSFINVLQDTLQIIEDILMHLSDDEYLRVCNNLLKLKKINDKNNNDKNRVIKDLMDRVNNNKVVRQHRMRTQMHIRRPNALKDDAVKMAEKDTKGRHKYERCDICDTIVLAGGIDRHKGNSKCKRIEKSKSICVDFKKKVVNQEFNVIDKMSMLMIKRSGRQAEEEG